MSKFSSLVGGMFVLGLSAIFFPAQKADASISDWQKGVSVITRSQADLSGESFRQSMRDLAATGANYVSLIIPYYQSDIYSTDIQRGYNTPTDASLAGAIDYIHSLGMQVMLKIHLDPLSGGWRAHINPSDRDTWYRNYEDILLHYADLGQQHGAESLCLGTELVSMASTYGSWENPERWKKMIADVRQEYSGQLTYSANWGADYDKFINEKNYIDFWDALDFIGISLYYPFNEGSSAEDIKAGWKNIDYSYIRPLAEKWNKPVVFTEIGYKSVNGSYAAPWDYGRETGFNEADQAKAYEALMSYWSGQDYMRGLHLWFWSADAGYGGQGNTDYSPQGKQAQAVMTQWFGGEASAPIAANKTSLKPQENSQSSGPGQDQIPTRLVTAHTIDIWWPSNGNSVQGIQPFKAVIYGLPLSEYTMYWQVDNDRLNLMGNSDADYPHKEAWVDLSGWNWSASKTYSLNFLAKDSSGNIIAQTPATIFIPS